MKRIAKDTVATFITLPLSVFQLRVIPYWLCALFFWIVIPVALVWLIIKIIWDAIFIPRKFHSKCGSIFLGYALIASIITLVIKYLLPDLGDKLTSFEPFSISIIADRLKAWFDYCASCMGTPPSYDDPVKGFIYISKAFIWLLIGAITGVFTYGLTYIPILAYIWIILFVLFLFAAVSEFKYGRNSAWVDFIENIWQNHIMYSFMITAEWCFTLYIFIPYNQSDCI